MVSMNQKVATAHQIAVQALITEPPPDRVALLGGSFDPPHVGHACLALSILSGAQAPEVWVLPCADHPHGKAMAPFSHRSAMCQLAFRHLQPHVKVLEIEKHLPAPSYTAQTLKTLHEVFPKTRFDWVIGSDLAAQLPSWQHADWLAQHVRFLVVGRDGHPFNAPPGFEFHIFEGLVLPNIASRNLRGRISNAESAPAGIDQAVWAYAQEKGVYDEGP